MKDRRSKWPKGFAHLDQSIDAIAHLRAAGVCQDRSRAQRSRAKLHPAVAPADHVSRNEPIHDEANELFLVSSKIAKLGGRGRKNLMSFRTRDVGTEKNMSESLSDRRFSCEPDMCKSGSSDCAARIPRCRLHEQPLERPVFEDSTVRDTIQRYPSRHTQVFTWGNLLQIAHLLQQNLFEHDLQAACNVFVKGVKF